MEQVTKEMDNQPRKNRANTKTLHIRNTMAIKKRTCKLTHTYTENYLEIINWFFNTHYLTIPEAERDIRSKHTRYKMWPTYILGILLYAQDHGVKIFGKHYALCEG